MLLIFQLFKSCDFFIFSLCCKSATDMAFLFVYLKNFLDKRIKNGVFFKKSFRNVFVNGAFADAEFFCGSPDGSTMFKYVLTKDNRSVGRIVQKSSLPCKMDFSNIYAREAE